MVTRSLNCELLISEVEKRPALYNFKLKEYNDKNLKEKLWTEVCEALVRGWNDLSPEEKNEAGRCFLRQMKYIIKFLSNVLWIKRCTRFQELDHE